MPGVILIFLGVALVILAMPTLSEVIVILGGVAMVFLAHAWVYKDRED